MAPITKNVTNSSEYTFVDALSITLSGRIGKVVASHAEGCNVARSNPGFG